MRARNY